MNYTLSLVFYFVLFFAIMYFLLIRPQQKQAKKRQILLNSLKTRDKVITSGGIHGKITKIKDDSVMLLIAEKVEVEVAKSGIVSVENRDVYADKDQKTNKSNKADKEEKPAKDETDVKSAN